MQPLPVEKLHERAFADLEFPIIDPGTDEATVLRFLTRDPEYGWPPKSIAERTDIDPNSISETLQRLEETMLVDCLSDRYFVNPYLRDEINGLLGDLHNVAATRTLPESNEPTSTDDSDVAAPHASEADIDDVLS
jgi:hypothetical protein